MISENKVILDMDQKEGIEITCKYCKESQTYVMRNKKIPDRPKTQCQNCGKWIYIAKSLLVKDDQRPNDQKDVKKGAKSIETPKKEEVKQSSSMTKNDQMTKPQKKQAAISPEPKLNPKQNLEVTNYLNGLATEVQLLGRTIPLDIKQKIVNEIFENLKNLTKGVKYYLNAWEARYKRYLKEKPGNPLIDEYEDMQDTLTFLNQLKLTKKELKNAKSRK